MSRGKKPAKQRPEDHEEPAPPSLPYQAEMVLSQLRTLYHSYVEPLEDRFMYNQFAPSHFGDTLISSQPFVLFLGPFSAGKSTFINYLLGQDVLYTGPEPTTNKFTVVMWGEELSHVTGHIMAASRDLPFRALADFGGEFLESFAGVQFPSPLLQHVTLIDTPGVLETADVHTRNYDYVGVTKWFIQRADLIFILFDPAKLDAGRELREVFRQLHGNESKVRIILNKADTVEDQELMRVYGSVFWNLSNLVRTTEPPRVYVSSFWLRDYRPDTNHRLFEKEKRDLLHDLMYTIPLQSLDHRVTAVLRRVSDVQIHCYIIAAAREKLPKWFGKRKAKIDTLDNLTEIYDTVALRYRLTRANFPPEDQYRRFFTRVDLYDMPSLADRDVLPMLQRLSQLMERDIPALLKPIAEFKTAPQKFSANAAPLAAPPGVAAALQPPSVPRAAAPQPQPPAYFAPPQEPPAVSGVPVSSMVSPVQSQLQRQMQLYLQQQFQQQAAAPVPPALGPQLFSPEQQQAMQLALQQQQLLQQQQQMLQAMALSQPAVPFAPGGAMQRSRSCADGDDSAGPGSSMQRSRTMPYHAPHAGVPPPTLQDPR